MREVDIRIRESDAEIVQRIASEHGDPAPAVLALDDREDGPWRLVRVQVTNQRAGALMAAVAERVDDARITLNPTGLLPLSPPLHDLSDRVSDVSSRSTLELVLDTMQSIGSWRGLLTYALISGLVAAYGVLFENAFLLTASMLIAPMGAPAMVAVVGVTLGATDMVRKGVVRFAAGLTLTTASAVALGLAYGIENPTSMMAEVTNLSVWFGLLAVAGGAAGAQALVRSERDSLVTATATGFLVAVALSPPSAVLGLSLALGRAEYALITGFMLLLTFFGVVVGGWISLRSFGVRPDDPTLGRGRSRRGMGMALTAALALVLLVVWQSGPGPTLRKDDVIRQAARATSRAVSASSSYRLLESQVNVVQRDPEWIDGEGLIVRAMVVPARPGDPDPEAGVEELRDQIAVSIRASVEGVAPFVDVVVIPR